MSQPIRLQSLVASPGAGFDAPFEMLEACHERVHRMLALLQRLRAHLRGHGADTQAQQAARDVMRYFDLAAPQHHRDEELHVFPPLLAQGDRQVVAVVRRLQADHRVMEQRWTAARGVLQSVVDGRTDALAASEEAMLESFAGVYEDHIRAEEEMVYPGARALLGEEDLKAAGAEMARRRGVV